MRDHATPDGGRAVVFTDITEKTRAETALSAGRSRRWNRSRDEARRQTGYLADLTKRLDSATAQADNAKTMLLRTMSHELKTPLNAILGFSDLIGTLSENLSPVTDPRICRTDPSGRLATCSRWSTRSWTSPRFRPAATICAR